MNAARIAALLRELADAFEDDMVTDETPPPSSPPKRERRRPTLVRPPGEPSPLSSARAAKILRDRGFR